MFQTEESIRQKAAMEVAERMATAARTAPKGKGRDTLKIAIVSGEELFKLAEKTAEIGRRIEMEFFVRDSECIRRSNAGILIGSNLLPEMLPFCGLCGFANCKEKTKANPRIPCVFNGIDVGIAVGSAVSVAADCRVDSRVMYTVGMAAMELGLMGEDVRIQLGIPISISAKSPFFDR